MSDDKHSSVRPPLRQGSEPSETEQAQIWARHVATFSTHRITKRIGRDSSTIVALIKDFNAHGQSRSPGRSLIQTVGVMEFHQGVDSTRILVNRRGDPPVAEICKVTSPYLHLLRLRKLRSLPHWRPRPN
ncbi:hypothetical protein Y032_0040g222 [Ancylostoma ceylanicum]|uniref:Uncharacterized protein n=1 Tax=Ancylostoma ceylanicum TaxID=53326 RepID=A0A016UHY0_9BILA|nr:hypothetical protein Y032_0040g222 [Ancylostoma ceylanicum]